ncbi:amidohydrolase family protein [Enterocloster clostridioformis]|uniref:amidohydrolase family protein n=1 Tax=Enterocloster clostridioformis TaxID=1531 RepID=UPI001F417189|nr:amidohydrolase family protein [Enterocloster clostridioformis]MCF2702033.1 amidohydrolase family protein [Enterocloster clostridioformis]
MEIPVLVHGKGIYDSDAMKMKYTGMVLEGSRIKEMGRFEELSQAYPDVRVMDFSDSYILPGLVNTHVHLEFTPCRDTYGIYRREDRKARLDRAAEHARTLLRSGVTTVRDAGSSMDLAEALSGREAGSEPKTELPRIQAAGMPLTPDGGHLAFLGKTSNGTEELKQAVKERKSAGCGCVKLIVSGGQLTPGSVPEHDTYSRGEIQAAVEAAHELGLPTAAHCLTTSSYVNAMEAGVDSVEHCACFRRNRRLGLLERYYEPDVMEAFLLEQEKRECEIFGRLADLGMRPLVGTDAGCGYTFFDETWLEMELLCRRCGLTPEKAIHAATLEGARALGYGDFLGRLAPGYEADFIAAAQNPIQDIEAFRHIKHVVCRGKIIE